MIDFLLRSRKGEGRVVCALRLVNSMDLFCFRRKQADLKISAEETQLKISSLRIVSSI